MHSRCRHTRSVFGRTPRATAVSANSRRFKRRFSMDAYRKKRGQTGTKCAGPETPRSTTPDPASAPRNPFEGAPGRPCDRPGASGPLNPLTVLEHDRSWLPRDKEKGIAIFGMNHLAKPTRQTHSSIRSLEVLAPSPSAPIQKGFLRSARSRRRRRHSASLTRSPSMKGLMPPLRGTGAAQRKLRDHPDHHGPY